MRLAHVVVRRDPDRTPRATGKGPWWWVCVEPECRLDEGLATQIVDHSSAIKSADAHARTSALRTSPVTADPLPATAPGGVRTSRDEVG